MLANYAKDPALFERCITLIDSIFPGIKSVAMKGLKFKASWPEVSIPFITESNGVLIAHLGIIPIDFILDGKAFKIAGIHGICVKEEYRRQGIFKTLMNEALAYVNKHFDSAILFTDQNFLYTPFNFKVVSEYDFEVSYANKGKIVSDFRKLNLENPEDLNIIHRLLANALPLSQHTNVKENVLFILNVLHRHCYYSKSKDVILVYEVVEDTLIIQDMLFTQRPKMTDILRSIPAPFNKVVLQFCPDQFKDIHYKPIPAKPECFIMVADNFPFEQAYFRFPETYRC